jgi:hypothetical protein
MDENPHHLILGRCIDFLSGKTIPDTHDEQYRQKLAKHLVLTLGYEKSEIQQNREILIQTGGQAAKIHVDFLVSQNSHVDMLVKYAPGSLVTRRLSNLALSRIITPYQIPVVVTTNGEDAEVVSGFTGKVFGQGLEAIPGPDHPVWESFSRPLDKISPDLFEKASRIAFACEVDGACPCDTNVCRLEDG